MNTLKERINAVSQTKTFNIVMPTIINVAYLALLVGMAVFIYHTDYYQNMCPHPFWKVCTP